MISVEKALSLYEQSIVPLPAETVKLGLALGRRLADVACSATDLPPYTQSAMDGYAVVADDLKNATAEHPARLAVVGVIPAGARSGDDSVDRIGRGQAARIFTGAALPDGADAVVRQERVRATGEELIVAEAVARGSDCRIRAEEITRGTPIGHAGRRLTAGGLAALANAGIDRVSVVRSPRVACLITGDELTEPGRALARGQMYDANSTLVSSWLQTSGFTPLPPRNVRDDLQATTEALERAFEEADAVLTTGGVSVGDRDYVTEAAEAAGARRVFWRVRQRPGKPLFFAMHGAKPLLGLPGNPASVFAGLTVHAQRVLDLLEGARHPLPLFAGGILSGSATPSAKRVTWLRCRASLRPDGTTSLTPLEGQGSHMISNLLDCNALARIPEGRETHAAGERVSFCPCGSPQTPGA